MLKQVEHTDCLSLSSKRLSDQVSRASKISELKYPFLKLYSGTGFEIVIDNSEQNLQLAKISSFTSLLVLWH